MADWTPLIHLCLSFTMVATAPVSADLARNGAYAAGFAKECHDPVFDPKDFIGTAVGAHFGHKLRKKHEQKEHGPHFKIIGLDGKELR